MTITEAGKSYFGPPTPVKEANEQQRRQEQGERRKKRRRSSLFKGDDSSNNNNNNSSSGSSGSGSVPGPLKRSKRDWPAPLPAEKVLKELEATGVRMEGGVDDDEQEEEEEEVLWREAGKTKKDKAHQGRCCRGINCVSLFCSSGDDDEDGALLYNATLLRKEQARFGELVREADRKNFVIEHVPLAKLSKGSMMAANSPVCNLAFRKLFGVSETLISACKRTPGARASSSSDRRYETGGYLVFAAC